MLVQEINSKLPTSTMILAESTATSRSKVEAGHEGTKSTKKSEKSQGGDECSHKSMNKKHVRTSDTAGTKPPGDGEIHSSSRQQKKAKASDSPIISKVNILLTPHKKTKTSNSSASKLNLLATLALTTSNKQIDVATSLNNKELKGSTKKMTFPPKKLRVCLKDGCGRILTGKQRKRCDEHHMLCIRKDCTKFVQDHDAGLCINHGAVKCPVATAAKKVRVCLKEGCGKTLTGQQRTRCKEHHWQCIKKGCVKNEQSNYGGFCKFHAPFKPVRVRQCMKDGCLAELRNPNHKRCSMHKNMCLHGDCTKHQQSNCNGYCREHASDEDRTRALKVDREKKRVFASKKPLHHQPPA